MKRHLATALALGIALAAVSARSGSAAVDVAVSISPPSGVVGRPVEVLVRTFAPINGDAIDLPLPSTGYAAPSGLWDVLYPFDYPFDVIARSPTGEEQQVALAVDPADASLWRGFFTPTTTGQWSIVMKNFPTYSAIQLNVVAGDGDSETLPIAIVALLGGLAGGMILGRVIRRPSSRDIAQR